MRWSDDRHFAQPATSNAYRRRHRAAARAYSTVTGQAGVAMRAASPTQFRYLDQSFELMATVRVSFLLAGERIHTRLKRHSVLSDVPAEATCVNRAAPDHKVIRLRRLAGKEWDKRAGLTALRRDLDRANSAEHDAAWKWREPDRPMPPAPRPCWPTSPPIR
jgi:hypothetical protein